jgi:hypothetical protein
MPRAQALRMADGYSCNSSRSAEKPVWRVCETVAYLPTEAARPAKLSRKRINHVFTLCLSKSPISMSCRFIFGCSLPVEYRPTRAGAKGSIPFVRAKGRALFVLRKRQ